MTATLTVERYLDALRQGVDRLIEHAVAAGPGADVPTCPGWTVRDLVAHLGMVQRWATAHVTATLDGFDDALVEDEGARSDDALGWLREGADALVAALEAAPDDLQAEFFLTDAPPPRVAWARRQAHEATVHAVDVLSASLGRVPHAAETPIPADLATDGIDELLAGFLPRPRTRLRLDQPLVLEVSTTDTDSAWTVHLGPDVPRTTHQKAGDGPDTRLTGEAVAVYLGLWNRGEELRTDGVDVLEEWRAEMRVSWGRPRVAETAGLPPSPPT
ncbi:maleylpyruvate isomerase family mycothiol-dependent enzyme [Desertihabitans aurantiacus]|uniref:maleylpyruvate isomerase family mycothiol-dependent enzyme n=1 Tax=Desertihabitans aurantiacus TaxID=2282477 RepID=UPI001E40B565|nr:maleylpyruvate isomerase family mycothiol-dependent enzyme [Desertihabitans aurantiacus]